MTNGLTEYPHIEPTKLVAVEAALERIDPNCYVSLYSEIIHKELERALYDQLSDGQNTLRFHTQKQLQKASLLPKNVRAGHITIKERLFLPPPHLLGLIKTELSQQIAMQSPQGQDF